MEIDGLTRFSWDLLGRPAWSEQELIARVHERSALGARIRRTRCHAHGFLRRGTSSAVRRHLSEADLHWGQCPRVQSQRGLIRGNGPKFRASLPSDEQRLRHRVQEGEDYLDRISRKKRESRGGQADIYVPWIGGGRGRRRRPRVHEEPDS